MKLFKPAEKQEFNIWMALLIGVGVGLIVSIVTLIRQINDTESTIRAYDYTDSAGIYTLKYPAEWTLELERIQCTHNCPPTPDWSVVSRDIRLSAPGETRGTIDIYAYTLAQAQQPNSGLLIECEATDESAAGIIEEIATAEVQKINGYDVCYKFRDWWRTDLSEGVKTHSYIYRKGDYFLSLSMVERSYSGWDNIHEENSEHLPAFRAIVRSVKFLK